MVKKQYEATAKNYSELADKLTVPKYQRGLVWSDKDKQEFVDTLANGFPFGSILIRKGDKGMYTVIDGQQRLTTINDLKKNPEKYWSHLDEIEKYKEFQSLSNTLVSITDKEQPILKEFFSQAIIKNSNEFDVNKLAKGVKGFSDIFGKSTNDLLDNLSRISEYIKKARQDLEKYVDVDNIVIPIIEFTGPEENLPSVFENLNRTGKKLSKYQVFAASWANHLITLNDTQIEKGLIESVINRYDRMTKARDNIEISDYNEQDIRKGRELNLSELAFGIGDLVINRLKSLITAKFDDDDLRDEYGFATLGIIVGIPNTKLSGIAKKFKEREIESNLSDELQILDNILQSLNKTFERLLEKPGMISNKQKEYENGLSKNFKILSYIAALWVKRDNKVEQQKILTFLPSYYLVDDLQNLWKSTGDKRLSSYYVTPSDGTPMKSYSLPVSQSRYKSAVESWIESDKDNASIQIKSVVKTIVTMHANLKYSHYYANNNVTSTDFEHIYSKKSLSEYYSENNIPGASVGNVMILKTDMNRSKHGKNLYDVSGTPDPEVLKNMVYPPQEDFEKVKQAIKNKKFGTIRDLILKREKDVFDSMANDLSIR